MKINKANYEIFFLDYHEGNLRAEEVAELFLFLEENPQMKPEFESFENIALPGSTEVYPDKEFLKKGFISESNYTRFFVGHVEGTLKPDEKIMLSEFLKKHPEYRHDLALFEMTRLQPDLSITFPDKRDLKKPVPLFSQSRSWYYVAAAACILLLLGAFFILQNRNNEHNMAERPVSPAPVNKITPLQQETADKQNEIQPVEKEPADAERKRDAGTRQLKPEMQVAFHSDGKKRNYKKDRMSVPAITDAAYEEISLITPMEPKLHAPATDLALKGTQKTAAPDYHTLTASTTIPSYPGIGQLLRGISENKMEKTLNDKEVSGDLLNRHIPAKAKGIRLMGWCLQKVTGKKVDVKTTYNPQGELTAYRITAGRLQFGRTFASR
jgi:hypothetical protein